MALLLWPSWAIEKVPSIADLRADADCVKNLATEPALAARRSALREEMHARLRAQGDPRMFGQGAVFDRYPHANPAHAGFYERFMRGERINTGCSAWLKGEHAAPATLQESVGHCAVWV